MGKILPGVFVSFANPKGGVGKSTLALLFAAYLASLKSGLKFCIVDVDDAQNSIGSFRLRELNSDVEESYKVLPISSSEFGSYVDYLKDEFDIIIVDFPGNLKQDGVVETLTLMDVVVMPFEPSPLCLSATLDFYRYYSNEILALRTKMGFSTIIKGLPNRINPNVMEYKELVDDPRALPFELMKNHIKDSRVRFQRNLSTILTDYDNMSNEWGDEMIELITKHIELVNAK
ncbi:MAG: ParA family protein [Bacteroides sp.]|nr:ParA family protein [Bacteroides sp.]